MKKQTWILIGLLLIGLMFFMMKRREGFESAKCLDGTDPNPRTGSCPRVTTEPTECPDDYTFQSTTNQCHRASDNAYTQPTCHYGMTRPHDNKCQDWVDPVCSGTLAMIHGSNIVCVPTGTSMFDTGIANIHPSQKLDPDVICKKPGHSIGIVKGGKIVCIENVSRSISAGTSTTTSAAASSTGGSSTSSFGPNSGGGDRRGRVFGPLFTSLGEGRKVPSEDSSKTNNYPELLGGGGAKKSTLVDGAGVVAPSKNWQLANDGSLPSSKGLGADEDSKYFPTSRSPGDMDVLPDPFRVSQMYSAANYSFKTEPVPFLTDFSAFQK